MKNPRPPAAPATLDLTLAEYFAAAGAIGLLSAQIIEPPDFDVVSESALMFGATMAAKARRLRKRRKR